MVALSDGTKFRPSRVWHTFFSPKGEVPLVGDFNFDGSDDIVTFLHDRVAGPRARSVFVALAQGNAFSRSFLWMTDFAAKSDVPAVGTLGGRLSKITGRSQDADKRTADLYAFRRTNGRVHVASSMRRLPYPSGAPLGALQVVHRQGALESRCSPSGSGNGRSIASAAPTTSSCLGPPALPTGG